jgi:hypothetical protein
VTPPQSVLSKELRAKWLPGEDCLPVGLAAVDDDPLGPAVPLESLAQEPFGGREIAPLVEL